MRIDGEGEGVVMIIRTMPRKECLELLSHGHLGRIAASYRALPAIWPVTYLVDGDTVLFGVSRNSTLGRATNDAIVAFQADLFDLADGSGWSVTGVGRSSFAVASDCLLTDIPVPWVMGAAAEQLVQVELTELSGHEVLSGPDQLNATSEELFEEVNPS
jgi:hypothetical protein